MPQPNQPADWKNLAVHPIAAAFPPMADDEYKTLRDDMLERGQQESILLFEGKILDGKARHKVCIELGLDAKFTAWEGDQTTLAAWLQAKGKNLARRHLSAERRVAILYLSAQAFPEVKQSIQKIVTDAEMRKQLGVKVANGQADTGEAADAIGRLVGASGSTAKRVMRVEEKYPGKLKEIADGATTCGKVFKGADQPPAAGPVAPAGKRYELVYADLGYPGLADKPVGAWADAKSALFLWTHPARLDEAFRLVLGWGLKYQTAFVWDKGGKALELLVLATRGHSPVPADAKRVVIKDKPKADGNKPGLFRELVLHLYPKTAGKRLDLCSPVKVNGWDQEPKVEAK